MTFSFRWGVDLFDNSRTEIPNMVFAHYHEIPWIDKEGNQGVGINNAEAMFVLHLASFRFERNGAKADPSLLTIAQRMGYKRKRSVINIVKSLESKGLLIVHRTNGKKSIYDFTPFSKAIIRVAMQDDPQKAPEKSEKSGVSQYTGQEKSGVPQYTGQSKPVHHNTPVSNKRPMYKNTPVGKTGVLQYTGLPRTGVSQYTRINTTTKGDLDFNKEFGIIIQTYEANIGSVSPLLSEDIKDTYRGLTPPAGETKLQWFRHAVKVAVENNVLKWKYVRAVLDGIQRAGSLAADQGEVEVEPQPSLPSPAVSRGQDQTLETVKKALKGRMTSATYHTYVTSAIVGLERQNGNGTVKFVVRTPAQRDWLDNRLRKTFEQTTQSLLPAVQRIEFIIATEEKTPARQIALI